MEAVFSNFKEFDAIGAVGKSNAIVSPLELNQVEHLKATMDAVAEFQVLKPLLARFLETGTLKNISPFETIKLVSVCKKPLAPPTLFIHEIAIRSINQETVDLKIDSMIDEKSTSEVSVLANWERLQDDPSMGDPKVVNDRVEFSKYQLVDSPKEIEPSKNSWIARLDLGSAGYRKVTYSISALSRYMQYYHESDRSVFSITGKNTVEIKHLNVSRPKKVLVDCLVPTLLWTSGIRKLNNKPYSQFESTARNGIRVYLGRGWSLGELMGVVVFPTLSEFEVEQLNRAQRPEISSDSVAPAELVESVSGWGADPITAVTSIPSRLPKATDFTGFLHAGGSLGLPIDGTSNSKATTDEKMLQNVAVLGFEPKWNEHRKLWYCDVGIDKLPSYGCFVRLSLVRYQPNSIKGMELSSVVLADFIQLRPERTVSIIRDPMDKTRRSLRVTITEPTDEARTPLVPKDPTAPSAIGVKNEFKVHVEKPLLLADGSHVGWVRDVEIDPPHESEHTHIDGILWLGEIVWPQTISGKRRLVIREFEVLSKNSESQTREVFCNVLDI